MTIRSYIFCFLLFAYGVILGHEVVYGHHTSGGNNCHQHTSGPCENHDEDSGHLPCLFDLNPHVASNGPDLNPTITDFDLNGLDSFLIAGLVGIKKVRDCDSLPPDREKIELYNFQGSRSHCLRGPPLA